MSLFIGIALGQGGPARGPGKKATAPPAKGPGAGKTAPAAAGKSFAPPAAPAPAAAKPLSMENIVSILKDRPSGAAERIEYDRSSARGIARATLTFEVEEPWLLEIQKTVHPDELRETYAALQALIHPGPGLEAISQTGPQMLDQLRDLVKANRPDDIAPLLHPELIVNQGIPANLATQGPRIRLASGSMATAFEMFDATRYQKHIVGKFRVLPNTGGWVGAPVYVLPTDNVEKFYFVIFSSLGGKTVIRDIIGDRAVAESRLTLEKDDAASKLRDLFRDLNQRSEATAVAISTPKLYADFANIGGWKRLVRGQRLSPENIHITTSVPMDQKSIRVVARVELALPGAPMVFDVDFERFGNEQKAVRVRHPDGTDIAVDTDLDCELPRRYQLNQPCVEYKTRYTDDVRFLSINKLKYNAQVAMEDSLLDRLDLYAAELETAFPADETRGLALGLRATSAYMKRDFPRANELGANAIAAGGEVFFPMLHLGGLFSTETQPQSMRLGISRKSIHYYPSYRSNRKEIVANIASVTKFEIDKPGKLTDPDPYITMEVELPNPEKGNRMEKQELHLLAFGSVCNPIGAPAPPATIEWTLAATCPGSVKGGGGGGGLGIRGVSFGRGKGPTSKTMVPVDWEKALTAVVRQFQQAKSGEVQNPAANIR
jgi:hypothetical protein